MRRSFLVAALIALPALLAIQSCKQKPPEPVVATAAQQAAAMQLGFAVGSFAAQDTQTLELRKTTTAGFAREESDLMGFMARLQLSESDASSAASALLDGFADPNPSRGSQLISEGTNLIMQRLSGSPTPELLWVFKVGITVGHMVEVANVLTRGNPQPEHLPAFMALTARNRQTLQEDLDRSGLPQEIIDAVQATNVEVRTVPDLLGVTWNCMKTKGLVEKLQ